MNFDIIVIGGGHAGIEAASAGARMGCSVALITMDRYALGRMSCNPAICRAILQLEEQQKDI